VVTAHDVDDRSQVLIEVSACFLKVLGDLTGQDVDPSSALTPCLPQAHDVLAVWTHGNLTLG
jgi:hypothetical protein